MGTSNRPGLDSSIFRAYDIRGIYPTELDENGAYLVGKAIQRYSKCKKVVVGRDARLSAPAIHQAVCQGLVEAGCEVYDAGMTGTDMIAWATGALDFDIAINITASHNPKEWIGLKIFKRGGEVVGGAGEIKAIGDLVVQSDDVPVLGSPVTQSYNLLPGWIKHVLSFVNPAKIRPLKIVVDAGNGVAGPIARELFRRLPVEVVEMYFEPDGNFPHHLPSPIEPANTADLQAKVKETGADLGIAFDGDADRMFLVDDTGRWVSGSETTALVTDAVLSEDASRPTIYNAICGWNVRDVILKHHASAYRAMVGHAYMRRAMKEHGAYFAGEHSGHYFFQKNYSGDSGLIAAMIVLGLISGDGRPLSQILQPHRKYFQIAETNFRVGDPKLVTQKLAENYVEGEADWLDGLTIKYPDWWFNVRLSSNEPLLRLNIEAISSELLGAKAAELSAAIKDLA